MTLLLQNTINTWIAVAYLILIVKSLHTGYPDITLFVEKTSHYSEMWCVVNDSSAISWTKLNENESSEYYPNLENTYDCKIGNELACMKYWLKKPWLLENSTNHYFGPVLDHRWETINRDDQNQTLNFIHAGRFKNNFELSLSIKASKEAQIFLCKGKPWNSECYWFLIGGWDGIKTALRKCRGREIPQFSRVYPQNLSCKMVRALLNHNNRFPVPLNRYKWTNFVITKHEEKLTLTNFDNKEVLLMYHDDEPIISDGFNMYIVNRATNGFWKIHNLEFIYSTAPSTTTLGPPLQPMANGNEYYTCVKMFIAMCYDCTLTLIIKNRVHNFEQKFENQNEQWKEVKFMVENTGPDDYALLVSTSITKGSGFWAIDNVKVCSKNEVRILNSINYYNDEIECQILQRPSHSLILKESSPFTAVSNCPGSTFGKYCTSCEFMSDNQANFCKKKILCNFNGDLNAICYCSTGFQGSFCQYECHNDFYGQNCMKRCGYCFHSTCNTQTGVCPQGCQGGFIDDKCRIPDIPVFMHPPTIINIGNTYCEVQMNNFNTFNNISKPELYSLQLRSADFTWKYINVYYKITDTGPKYVFNLNISTTYHLRAILATVHGNNYVASDIPFAKFETHCRPIQRADVDIITTNISAQLIIKVYSETCSASQYLITYKDKVTNIPASFIVILEKLSSYTTYKLAFVRNEIVQFFVNFRTLEGVPSKVRNIRQENTHPFFLTLKWIEPLFPNGLIKHYIIYYKHINYIDCPDEESDYMENLKLEVRNTSVMLSNLEPYSKYLVKIYASTTLIGEPSEVTVTTSPSDIIKAEELPVITEIIPGTTTITVKLSMTECKVKRGLLWLQITTLCYKQLSKTITISYPNNGAFTVHDLYPFSDCMLKIQFGRSENVIQNELFISQQFKTLQEVPNPITSLTVYSKTANSISLRWSPPDPSLGILFRYKIKYFITGYYTYPEYKTIEPYICPVWKEDHCATIEHLNNNTEYVFSVYAANEGPTPYSSYSPRAIKTTGLEVSSPPNNLTIKLSYSNELTLTWTHPDFTTGLLKVFLIKIVYESKVNHEYYTMGNYSKYNLTYTHMLQHTLLASTKYSILINAITYLTEGFSTSIRVYSYPSLPKLRALPKLLSLTNLEIKLSIPQIKKDAINRNDNSSMFVIISGKNILCPIKNKFLKEILRKLNGNSCVILENSATENLEHVNIKIKNNMLGTKISFEENTYYNITIILINEFMGKYKQNIYVIPSVSLRNNTNDVSNSTNNLFYLTLLLILIPGILWIFYSKNKLKISRPICENFFGQICIDNGIDRDIIPLPTTTIKTRPAQQSQHQQISSVCNTEESIASEITTHSSIVQVSEFEQYVKKALQTGLLEAQHKRFPRGQTKPWEYGALKPNKMKNRYNNLVAYDHSRVKLKKSNGDIYSDYINANYIDGYKKSRAYIATQGPKISTVDDFWKMIWQENVKYIVMLANIYENGKKKCEKYWPNINDYLEFGDIQVKFISVEVFADYEHRKFRIIRSGVERNIDQLHFTSWPDHGVPLYSQNVIPFLSKMLHLKQDSPILVHCSAGVGRTGTIILSHICLQMALQENIVNLYGTLAKLREQRVNMVDNPDQYKLAHLVLLEYFFCPYNVIPCDMSMEPTIRSFLNDNFIEQQMEYIENTRWQDLAMIDLPDMKQTANNYPEKNRFSDLLPDTCNRVFLSPYPISDESSTYINAVVVNSYREVGKFIVTQQPLPTTIGDFWRLILEKEITTVVSLNTIDLNDKTTCEFWPTETHNELQPVPYITLKYIKQTDAVFHQIISVRAQAPDKNIDSNVHLVIMKSWKSRMILPEIPEKLIFLWEEVGKISRNSNHVLISCYDGATASGLFISLSFLIEKIKLEQECDVYLAVRTAKRSRKQFMVHKDQFIFLYEAAIKYVKDFENYSNFTSTTK